MADPAHAMPGAGAGAGAGAAGGAAAGPPAAAAAAAAMAMLQGVGDQGGNRVAELAERARQLKAQRQQVAKEHKAEVRKRRKIMEKAKQLSNDELVEVLAARANAKGKGKGKGK